MTQDRKPPNPARRNERSRQAILTATADLLGEVGYTKLTVEAIAARAGVGKQTIYRWWTDKGALVLDAYLDAALDSVRSASVPTPGDDWFSAGVVSDGRYGIPAGLIYSVPLRSVDGRPVRLRNTSSSVDRRTSTATGERPRSWTRASASSPSWV